MLRFSRWLACAIHSKLESSLYFANTRLATRGGFAIDNLTLSNIAERVLKNYAEYPCAAAGVETRLLFDRERDQYALVTLGWEGVHHHYSVVAHLEIINDRIYIQEDNTEEGIATDLEAAGVPKHQIVLGFRHPQLRPFTEYAAA